MPVYNLPPKILCRVVNVLLKVLYSLVLVFGNTSKLSYWIFGSVYNLFEGFLTGILCFSGDQAEADTDEVFAQITLMPEANVS